MAAVAAVVMALAAGVTPLEAASRKSAKEPKAAKVDCAECEAWNADQEPFRIWGNTYYVGTKGLSAVLVTSDWGHTLIDGGLPQSAPKIAANIEKLGFKITDVKAIFNSHAHFDHAGGIAELQRLSGAKVYTRRPADEVLRSGKPDKNDPQLARLPPLPPIQNVWVVHDGELMGLGSTRFTVVGTSGHTDGGTSWAWDACEKEQCLKMVYADSLNAVSVDGYKFSAHPDVLQAFEQSFTRLAAVPCEFLVSAHPDQSDVFARIGKRVEGKLDSLKDPESCKRYVQGARERLAQRLESEKKAS